MLTLTPNDGDDRPRRAAPGGSSSAHQADEAVLGLDVREAMALVRRAIAPLRPRPWEADDIAQEVLLKALEGARRKALEEGRVERVQDAGAYIATAARNEFRTRVRNRRYDTRKMANFAEALRDAAPRAGPHDVVALREALARIDDPRLRQLLLLGLLGGLNLTEAAEEMRLARTPARTLAMKLNRFIQWLAGDEARS